MWLFIVLAIASVAAFFANYTWLAFPFAIAAIIAWGKWDAARRARAIESTAPDPARRIERLRSELEFFRDYENQYDEATPSGFVLGRHEHLIALMSGAVLMESRRGPTQFSGGALGMSLRVSDRVSVRPTGFRGRSVPGEETPTVIDEGTFLVTDERGVFVGQKQSREFAWSKLLSYQVAELGKDAWVMYLPVSGRQKVSGIGADQAAMDEVAQRVAFAVAVATGRKEAFIALVEKELHALETA